MKKFLMKKSSATVIAFMFFGMLCFSAGSPLPKISTQGDGDAKVVKKDTIDDKKIDSGSFMLAKEGKKKPRKKIPWLLIVGGVVVLSAAVYFLVIKKTKYKLNVNIGEGVSGTPAAGTTEYKKGAKVNYSFTQKTGYSTMTVILDGVEVATSGSITMDGDHTLSASAVPVATVNIKSTPQGANIIMDGTDTGHKTNHTYTFNTAGSHNIVLQKLGYLELKKQFSAVLGNIKDVAAILVEGLNEHFLAEAESQLFWKWEPRPDGKWNCTGGEYSCNATIEDWNYNVYNYKISKNQFTVTSRLKRADGDLFSSNSIILAESQNANTVKSYLFNYTASGSVSIWRQEGSLGSGNRTYEAILNWTSNSAVKKGRDVWNVIKVIRDGSSYAYYLNNKLIHSFTDNNYDVRYLYILGYDGGSGMELSYDFVKIENVGQSARIPLSPPVSGINNSGNPGSVKNQ